MDPISAAIIAAVSAGAISGVTETSKAAISDAYSHLKELLGQKFGAKSEVVAAVAHLEAKPDSAGRQTQLQEEVQTSKAEHDQDVVAAAQRVLQLVQPQQAGLGKFSIQNTGTVQGQNVGDHNSITQHFGEMPTSS